jgi:hypothetical protein
VRWKKICKQGDTVGEEIGSDDDEEWGGWTRWERASVYLRVVNENRDAIAWDEKWEKHLKKAMYASDSNIEMALRFEAIVGTRFLTPCQFIHAST